MYARFTSTRMKGSQVVQGLKSLASKLHPQLPLSSKESQRLLTALTSSFRQQLNEAHPPSADGTEGRPKAGNASISKTGAHSLHSSSAAFADKHLASVLTNPLLAQHDGPRKPILDLRSAKQELLKNPAKDPISLLEEYHKKGAATIPIAALCLETFKQNVEKLPKEQQDKAIAEAQAGKRTLLWLWKTKLYETDAFVDANSFKDAMVPFVVKEGAEEYIWDWLSLDMKLGTLRKQSGFRDRVPGYAMNKRFQYRWRGRVLSGLVRVKLDESTDMSADSAIGTFLRACDMKQASLETGGDGHDWPLLPSLSPLVRSLYRHPSRWVNTDPAMFDQLLKSLELAGKGLYRDFDRAKLHLSHPKSPSPFPALQLLKLVSSTKFVSSSKFDDDLIDRLKFPKEKDAGMAYWFMVRTAAQLQDLGRTDDSKWVISFTEQLHPEFAQYLQIDMEQKRRAPAILTEARKSYESSQAGSGLGVPFPSFG